MNQIDRASETRAASDPDLGTSADVAAAQSAPRTELRSLAPDLKVAEHAVYVGHLEKALDVRRNKNIALTGRYGSGKSSVLNQFLENVDQYASSTSEAGRKRRTGKWWRRQAPQRQHKTLQISISTLGPVEGDDDITNRIEKELVKQLLYRAEPGTIRRSRFARRPELTWWRRLIESSLVGIGLVTVLWLFGIRPDITLSGADSIWGPVVSTMLLAVLIAGGAWVARGNMRNGRISKVSAGGATISIDDQADSYFDKYLDEIVAFFDATEIDLVVFEDLDRFNDPRIFEALRELNTLINASAHWKKREQPLRFIYAIKDSVFQMIGEELTRRDDADGTRAEHPAEDKSDVARVATERANRTKFFELVIPVVPFLSHTNARDLLVRTLEGVGQAENTKIDRKLIDLVARHTTDMRLMLNICNEFVIFAQKLLWSEGPASGMAADEQPVPGVTADDLFALVAYKNFHPADFEALPHRSSALDKLEQSRRKTVQHNVTRLQGQKTEAAELARRRAQQESTAEELASRLTAWADAMKQSVRQITVGTHTTYKPEDFYQPDFWRRVSKAKGLRVHLQPKGRTAQTEVDISETLLKRILPEALDASRWQPRDQNRDRALATRNSTITLLRGADFKHLIEGEYETPDGNSFVKVAKEKLESDLAWELVAHGFLTRYYAECSSIFYGNFVGVEVANFFRNCVWPNEVDIYFKFPHSEALRNLLDQAPEGFTESRSVLNIDVVDYLLEHDLSKAERVAAFIVTDAVMDGMTFLDAFLKHESSQKRSIVQLLAQQPWRGLFEHIARPGSVDTERTRAELLDVALLAAQSVADYDPGDGLGALLIEHYKDLDSFTQAQDEDTTSVIHSFVHRLGLTIPSLRPLSPKMLQRSIEDGTYELTADNLRRALDLPPDAPVTVDSIREDARVWQKCRESIDDYFSAVEVDEQTTYTVQGEDVLIEVLLERPEEWSDEHLASILESSSPQATINRIADVDQEARPAIVRARRMACTAPNVLECILEPSIGEPGINADLACFLEEIGELRDVSDLGRDDAERLAMYLLNSRTPARVLDPGIAVSLVRQIGFTRIEVSRLEPCQDDLLALLLEAELVPDDRATFEHFIQGVGWPEVSRAFKVSTHAHDFLDPDLVSDVVADLLEGETALDALKGIVVRQLRDYVADDNDRALRAAGAFARSAEIGLPIAEIERIADADPAPEDVAWQLYKQGADLSTASIFRVLVKLGGGCSSSGEFEAHDIDVPWSEERHEILTRLENDGYVERQRVENGRLSARIVR